MRILELTRNKVSILDDEDFERLNQWKWMFDGRYAARWITKPSKSILEIFQEHESI